MTFTRKLTLLILVAFCAVVGVQAITSIRREIAIYDSVEHVDVPDADARRRAMVRGVTSDNLTAAAAYLVFAGIMTTLLTIAFVTLPARRVLEQASEDKLLAVADSKRRMADLEELQRANRLVTVAHVGASMAHELGTPLAVVLARARMIAEGLEPASELRNDAEVIVQQAKRMSLMVAEVLALTRAQPPTMTVISLDSVVAHGVALLQPLVRQAHVQLKVEGTEPEHPIHGNESRLLQILTNLVINAKQATTTKGTVFLTVDRKHVEPPPGEGRGSGSYVCLHVRDEGTGIAPEDVPRVFDTFFTTKTAGEGSGLGLAVSLRIARAHGGWIDVASAPGRGSCFTLYLPELSSSSGGAPEPSA